MSNMIGFAAVRLRAVFAINESEPSFVEDEEPHGSFAEPGPTKCSECSAAATSYVVRLRDRDIEERATSRCRSLLEFTDRRRKCVFLCDRHAERHRDAKLLPLK